MTKLSAYSAKTDGGSAVVRIGVNNNETLFYIYKQIITQKNRKYNNKYTAMVEFVKNNEIPRVFPGRLG